MTLRTRLSQLQEKVDALQAAKPRKMLVLREVRGKYYIKTYDHRYKKWIESPEDKNADRIILSMPFLYSPDEMEQNTSANVQNI